MQHYVKITREAPKVTGPPASGGYNSGPMTNPVLNKDYIWLDFGTQSPSINQTFVPWAIQSVVPKRGLTRRLAGSDQYRVAGSFTTVFYHEQAPFWKDAVLEPTVDGTTNVQDLPSYTIDRAIWSNGGVKWTDRFTGVKFTQATLTGSNEGTRAPITLAVSLSGSTRTEVPGNPAFPGTGAGCGELPVSPYRWNKSQIILGVGKENVDLDPIIRSWSVQISHILTERINKGLTVNAMAHHGWNPSLSAVWDTDDWTFKQRYIDIVKGMAEVQYGTSTLTLSDTATTGTTVFTWENLVLSALQDNLPVADFLTENGRFDPHFDCTRLDMHVAYTAGTPVSPTSGGATHGNQPAGGTVNP